MEKRAQKKNEIIIGLIILALICIMIFLKQYGFNPPATAQSALEALETGTGSGSSTESASLISLPENFSVMTPLETFTPDTLYEKINGQEYIEMRAGSTSNELKMAMHTVAREYVENNALETVTIAGVGWFPKEGLNQKSITMVSSNAFGFERLNQVYTAEYLIDGETVTAFISQRADNQEATELASAFGHFYLQFGGQELTTGFPSPNGKTIEIMDSIHIIFSKGIYLAGVHKAQDMDAARELASRLHTKIGVMNGG